jgi:hypothetical protein
MRHRKPDQEPLRPTIVPVKLTAREREAYRRLSSQRSASRRPLGFDPLELRLGLRAQYRSQRPHYAISNPQYDQVLKRCPGARRLAARSRLAAFGLSATQRAGRASLAAEVAQPQSRAVAPQADEAAKRKPACSRCRSPDFCAALGCADIAVHGWNRDEAAQPESAVASASQCDSTIVEAARKGLAAILELRDSSDESLECEMWPRIEDAIAALRQALEAKA